MYLQDEEYEIPQCNICGEERIFELQVLPTIISLQGLQWHREREDKLEFGNILIYSCPSSCTEEDTHFYQEHIILEKMI